MKDAIPENILTKEAKNGLNKIKDRKNSRHKKISLKDK